MDFKDGLKIETKNGEKILLIVEDDPDRKLSFLQEDLRKKRIPYKVVTNYEDALEFFRQNRETVDTVILDCELPRNSSPESEIYDAGLVLIPHFIHFNPNIAIIFNTLASFSYTSFPEKNTIYTSANQTVLSSTMNEKLKRDPNLKTVFALLLKNNARTYTKTIPSNLIMSDEEIIRIKYQDRREYTKSGIIDLDPL